MNTDEQGWVRPDWPLAGRVSVLTTQRHGGASQGAYGEFNLAGHVGDDPAAVSANRQRLMAATGCESVTWLNQVHGTRVVRAPVEPAAAEPEPEADALWTSTTGAGLAILTADCLPVVICRADGSAVGVAHAGWRGLLAGVLDRLIEELGGSSSAAVAWIGPAISVDAYEVGEDVASRVRDGEFADAVLVPGRRPGKHQLNLPLLAELRLLDLGVSAVYQSAVCSARTQSCYSYRRDGATGRMATLAWLPAR